MDATTLHFDINLSSHDTSVINSELAQVLTWLNANKICLNVKKTNYMITSKRNRTKITNIFLRGHSIARTSKHNFLCGFIGNKLKFAKHINKLRSQVS